MAKRRNELKADSSGQYFRQIGWKVSPSGKRSQPKFRLGRDRSRAQVAYEKLGQLWDAVVEKHRRGTEPLQPLPPDAEPDQGQPVWTDATLTMAEAIRKHKHSVAIPHHRYVGKGPAYMTYLYGLREIFGDIIAITADDTEDAQEGRDHFAAQAEHRARKARLSAQVAQVPIPAGCGVTLYEALDAYAEAAKSRHQGVYGRKEADAARRHKQATTDMDLAELDYNAIERITLYWCSRPMAKVRGGKGKGQPIAVSTVVNQAKVLRRFIRWLHRNSAYQWQMPVDVDTATRVSEKRLLNEDEIAALKDGPKTYTTGELVTLYRVATDAERALLLFGLNLGFAQAECESFRLDEIDRENDPPRVCRIRRKSHRYHEVALWPETIQAIDWLATERGTAGQPFVLLSERGARLNSQSIANRWAKLLDRVQKDEPGFRRLPFKHLRKTAGQLVRNVSDGETVGVFHARAQVNSDDYSDEYTRRDFGKVFKANAQVRDMLAPMFEAAPDAFTSPRKRGGSNVTPATIERIRQLWQEGQRAQDIAQAVGVSRPTVYRWKPEPAAA